MPSSNDEYAIGTLVSLRDEYYRRDFGTNCGAIVGLCCDGSCGAVVIRVTWHAQRRSEDPTYDLVLETNEFTIITPEEGNSNAD